MALFQNPYKLNAKATTFADQLDSTRALDWELNNVWTMPIDMSPWSWRLLADDTRAHVAWASRCRGGPPTCNSRIRVVLAQLNTVPWALLREPAAAMRASTKADDLPRMALVRGMSESRDIVTWAQDRNLMVHALSSAIRTDPSAYVRLEVLRAIGFSPIPVEWVPTLLDAIQRAEAVLAQTPFDQSTRQTLAKYLSDVTAKLQSSLVQVPSPTGQGTELMTSGAINLPKPEGISRVQVAVIVGISALLLGGGVLAWRRRVHQAQPALAGPAAPRKRLRPAEKAKRMIAEHGGLSAEQQAYHREDHATSANEATYWSKVAQQIQKQRSE